MTRHILFLLTLFLFSCGPESPVADNRSTIALIDRQIEKVIEEIKWFGTSTSAQDTDNVLVMQTLRNQFNEIRFRSKSQHDSITIRQVKALYTDYGSNFNFITITLKSDIDSLSYAEDKQLKLAVNELCLISRLSNAIMKRNIVFDRFRLEKVQKTSDEFDIFLVAHLDTVNSSIGFGCYDFETNKFIKEFDSTTSVKIVDGHYRIKGNKQSAKFANLRVKSKDGSFSYYCFDINK